MRRDTFFDMCAGRMLKAYREKIGLSFPQVYLLTGVDSSVLFNIEKGSRTLDYESLYLLSKLYGTSISEIIYPDISKYDKFVFCDYREPDEREVNREILKAKLRFLSIDEKIFLKKTLENFRILQDDSLKNDEESGKDKINEGEEE